MRVAWLTLVLAVSQIASARGPQTLDFYTGVFELDLRVVDEATAPLKGVVAVVRVVTGDSPAASGPDKIAGESDGDGRIASKVPLNWCVKANNGRPESQALRIELRRVGLQPVVQMLDLTGIEKQSGAFLIRATIKMQSSA
jgi:hypothetical protein